MRYTAGGSTIPKGCVTEAKTESKSPCKTGTSEGPLTPKITTLDLHSATPAPPGWLEVHFEHRKWIRIQFHDEAPAIGSGLRLVAVDRLNPQWVRIRDHAGRTAKLDMATYASLKGEAFGHSVAMEQYEARFPNAAETEEAS